VSKYSCITMYYTRVRSANPAGRVLYRYCHRIQCRLTDVRGRQQRVDLSHWMPKLGEVIMNDRSGEERKSPTDHIRALPLCSGRPFLDRVFTVRSPNIEMEKAYGHAYPSRPPRP
jgi:hypothetical protein